MSESTNDLDPKNPKNYDAPSIKASTSPSSPIKESCYESSKLSCATTNFRQNNLVIQSIHLVAQKLKEIESQRLRYFDQLEGIIIEPIVDCLKQDIQPIKEWKKKFEKHKDDLESSVVKYMAKKPKDTGIPEVHIS